MIHASTRWRCCTLGCAITEGTTAASSGSTRSPAICLSSVRSLASHLTLRGSETLSRPSRMTRSDDRSTRSKYNSRRCRRGAKNWQSCSKDRPSRADSHQTLSPTNLRSMAVVTRGQCRVTLFSTSGCWSTPTATSTTTVRGSGSRRAAGTGSLARQGRRRSRDRTSSRLGDRAVTPRRSSPTVHRVGVATQSSNSRTSGRSHANGYGVSRTTSTNRSTGLWTATSEDRTSGSGSDRLNSPCEARCGESSS